MIKNSRDVFTGAVLAEKAWEISCCWGIGEERVCSREAPFGGRQLSGWTMGTKLMGSTDAVHITVKSRLEILFDWSGKWSNYSKPDEGLQLWWGIRGGAETRNLGTCPTTEWDEYKLPRTLILSQLYSGFAFHIHLWICRIETQLVMIIKMVLLLFSFLFFFYYYY